MSEKVLGTVLLWKPKAIVFLTSDRVITARLDTNRFSKKGLAQTAAFTLGGAAGGAISALLGDTWAKLEEKREGYLALALEDVLEADERNFAIPNSEIMKFEMKKAGKYGAKIHITTSKKKHKWLCIAEEERKQGKEINMEDFENMLRPVFGDKLSVRK
jgi:hypothetical protein